MPDMKSNTVGDDWFAGKDLTRDMLRGKAARWLTLLEPWRDKPCDVLEVGSYEGRSAIVFLEYLFHCRLTAIDIFMDPAVEARFDRNMADYGTRVTKIKARAIPTMERMVLNEDTFFDVIYLDTGKRRVISHANSVLAWPLLRIGGIMIWDDFQWGQDKVETYQPGLGIRLFAEAFSHCMEVLYEGNQLIAKKISEWPPRKT